MSLRGAAVAAGLVLTAALGICAANAAPSVRRAEPSAKNLRASVTALCNPGLAGRGNGTTEMGPCSAMVARWFYQAGLSAVTPGTWYQTFTLQGEGIAGAAGRNIVGKIEGAGSLAHRWIVVGAHYDHLGRTADAPGEGYPARGQYYPGANDNGSGVALLLEVAALAARGVDRPRRSVLFVAFAGEEIGLQGSTHLVDHPLGPADNIELMLNFDSVGRLATGGLHVGGVGTAPGLREHLAAANSEGLDLHLSAAGWAGSDHVAFLTHEIPALFFFTGAYPEYNRPTDLPETLDYDGLVQTTAFVVRLLEELRADPNDFVFQVVAGAPDATAAATGEGHRSTWFGSVPDFTPGVAGYQLAGVLAGSPAAMAGLAAGDVVVGLGGVEVADLPSFTRALRQHLPGDLVEVQVRREGRLLRYTVVLGDRADRQE